jgi:hypothetical protein
VAEGLSFGRAVVVRPQTCCQSTPLDGGKLAKVVYGRWLGIPVFDRLLMRFHPQLTSVKVAETVIWVLAVGIGGLLATIVLRTEFGDVVWIGVILIALAAYFDNRRKSPGRAE